MKFVTKIAPVALLSLLLLPTESQSMMGRALGGLAGGGIVVAGAYGAERYGDRLGSIFARGAQSTQDQIVNQAAASTAEQVAEKSTRLAENLIQQADKTLAIAERIVDSRLFPYAIAGGLGYIAYKKLISGNTAVKKAIVETKDTILQKLSLVATEIKSWVSLESDKIQARLTEAEENLLSSIGILAEEITKYDIKTQEKLKLILNNLQILNMSNEEFKVLVSSNQETVNQRLNLLQKTHKKEFKLINQKLIEIAEKQEKIEESQSRTEQSISEVKNSQIRTESQISDLNQKVSDLMVYLHMKPDGSQQPKSMFFDNFKLYWQSRATAPNAGSIELS